MSFVPKFTIPKRSAAPAAAATAAAVMEVTTTTTTTIAVYPYGPTIVPSSPISGKKRTPLESPPVTPGTVYVGTCTCEKCCISSPRSPWDPMVQFSPIEETNATSAVSSPVKGATSFLEGLPHLCASPSPTPPPYGEEIKKRQNSSHRGFDKMGLHVKRLHFEGFTPTNVTLRAPLSFAEFSPPVIKRSNKCEKNCPVGDCTC